ncbi:MAG: aminotransferase class I/II-fold pyridoxal phosphate-dependent enzyme [Rhodobacteraceae bacterium]|nr:aminotransferase class I/II-fold pyridoxal phosphate-dependent enzyme [Paracoccaceae bacterium]
MAVANILDPRTVEPDTLAYLSARQLTLQNSCDKGRYVRVFHGGGLDAAISRRGGHREDWIDLSTGINPRVWPVPTLSPECFSNLPDRDDSDRLIEAARRHWGFPRQSDVVPAPGVSSLIARLPFIKPPGTVTIRRPTYGEYAFAFTCTRRTCRENGNIQIIVHPNNLGGLLSDCETILAKHRHLTIIDESFCDTGPELSHAGLSSHDGIVVHKGIGKLWGLAVVRLGFAAWPRPLADRIRKLLGPWPVSGPAVQIGLGSLSNEDWIIVSGERLRRDASRLDSFLSHHGFQPADGIDPFRLYCIPNASAVHRSLARRRILVRTFDHSCTWIWFGFPKTEEEWTRLEEAVECLI